MPVSTLLKEEGISVEFLYDFGDHWAHTLTRVALPTELPELTADTLPHVHAGTGACPPDDIGGVLRYDEVSQLWRTKKSMKALRGTNHEDLID